MKIRNITKPIMNIKNLFPHHPVTIVRAWLAGAICGLGLLTNAQSGTILQLDLGDNSLAANGAAFTKISTADADVNNGSYYEFDNVAGTSFTLTFTNVGNWSPGTASLASDGFYNLSGNGPAYFSLSGLPAGMTVTLHACYGWDGSGRGAVVIFGGTTNTITDAGTEANPSVANMQTIGRAEVDATGTVNGTWYGQGGLDSEGQIGAMILDIEPCQPVLTLNGVSPMMVPINSVFTDPGATAVESCSGATLAVTTVGRVTNTVLGSYTLTYSAVADGTTNSITRTVNVVSSDFLNLELAENGSSVPTAAGFDRLNYYAANMSFSAASVAGATYTVVFTNVSGTWTPGGATIDEGGYYCNSGVTSGFALSGLAPGSLVTLYACWAWDGANNAAVITYADATNTLNVGSGITSPSPDTFMNVGTAVADATGAVSGTWTGNPGHQGQIGGMIFSVQAPQPHSLAVLPPGFTNNCGAGVTFTASASAGASLQWYNNVRQPVSGGTNTTLVLGYLHPSDSGNWSVVASGSGWSVTNLVPISIIDVAPPVMTMTGSSTMVLPLHAAWTEPGVTAYDSCAENNLTVTTAGTVNTSVAGEYDLTYTATTADGIQGTLSRAVVVIDTANIQADYQMEIDFQSASDFWGTSPGFAIVAPFDIGQGTYGNASIPDPMSTGSPYVLNLTNISCWDQGSYQTYQDISTAGIYNYDLNDVYSPAWFSISGLPTGVVANVYAVYGWGGQAMAAKIIYAGATNQLTVGITTNSPNPPTQDDFQFLGSAVALDGSVTGEWYGPTGPGSEGQIGGMIINIQSIPAHNAVITAATSTPQCGSSLTFAATVSGLAPFTYQWYDNHSNPIAGATNATYTLGDVRPSGIGNYTVIAKNAFGSATNSAAITDVQDTAAPIMALNGPNPAIVLVNYGSYQDAGATAFDLCAQISLPVSTDNPVDITTIGSYTVTYYATNSSGIPGSLTRTVNVVAAPNDTLMLDFAPAADGISAPAGFTKVENGPALTVGNYDFPAVAGTVYDLSFTNIGSYNTANTNESLTTDGFYSAAANGPAYFTIAGAPEGAKVTIYAIYAWDLASKYADVYFGNTNAQIVYATDPGTAPTLSSFTLIGSAPVGPSCAVSGHWQGPGGPNSEGQVGGMIIIVHTNIPPVANNLTMSAASGQPSVLKIVGAASGPVDPDGDPLTVTAVQSPTTHGGTATTDGVNVTYVSAGGFAGTDSFTYTVGDGFGGFATADVSVSVTSTNVAFNKLAMPTRNGTAYQVHYLGLPNSSYVLLKSPTLAPPVWTPVSTNQADGGGAVLFQFNAAGQTAFYRTVSVP